MKTGIRMVERGRSTPIREALLLVDEWEDRLPAKFKSQLWNILRAGRDEEVRELLKTKIENDVEEGAFGG